jgi:hypothetical protein
MLATGATAATAATNPADSPVLSGSPIVTLPVAASGPAAVDALGSRLPDVAKAYGWTAGQLTSRLRTDRSLNVDTSGHLFYKDPAPTQGDLAAAQAGAVSAASAGAAPQALQPLTDTFKLHSLPGAAHIVYLDFDGQTLSGCAWTNNLNGGNDIVAPPYSIDGDPTTFSDAELTAIQLIWQRVAEDYAPLNVDVTTEYMGESYLTRTSTSDNLYGMRVLISPLSSYLPNAGGVAWVGAFNAVGDYNKPALVFPEMLGLGNDKIIAEAAAHENGHTLGLSHQGTTAGVTYYNGQGSGETGWAPIMGTSYYRNLSQWSKGEYLNANTTEDEVAVMGTYGAPLRSDDVGGTTSSATYLGTTGILGASGFIGSPTDADVFRVSWAAGPLTVRADPAAVGADLDILLDLLDSRGSVVASSNPADLLAAGISVSVAKGTYYIRVRGTGKGDPLVDGYSSYGSRGAYAISVSNTPGQPAAPTDLQATATSSSAIALHWTDNATNETAYYIDRWNTASGAWERIAATAADATSYTNSGLSPSTTYRYTVSAYNIYATAGAAGYVEATTPAPPPAKPTGLTATAIDATSIRLDWTDAATDETGYYVNRWNTASKAWDTVATTAADASTYTDGGLNPSTTYYYYVGAFNGNGVSWSAAYVSAATPSDGGVAAVLSVVPGSGPEAGGNAVVVTGSRFTGATEVRFGSAPAAFTVVDDGTVSIASVPSGTGTVDVTVTTPAGTSAAGASDRYTYVGLPAAPTGLTAAGASTSTIVIGWSDNATNEAGYRIDRWNGASGTWERLASTAANATAYTDTGLDPGSGHTYRVASYNVAGEAWSGGSVSATTLPLRPAVSGLAPASGPATGGTSVIISGSNLLGATSVSFGGAAATTFVVNSSTQITATAPAHAAGTVDVVVTTLGGSSPAGGSANDFTYLALTRVDQTSPFLVNTGTWANYATTAAYGGSYGRSSTSGASVSIYFTGNRLDWIAMKGTTTGSADVYLDGAKVTTVNLAASSSAYQVAVWSTGPLANGAHVVKIVRSTSSGSGKYLTMDAVDIWGTISAPPVTLTRYEQTVTQIVKSGTWSNYSAGKASGGTYGRSSTGGAWATIYFNGTRLDWIATEGTTTGIADVYLDGTKVTTIDLAAPSTIYQANAWSTGTLAYGAHTVKIVRSTASASGRFLTLDAVDIWGTMTSGS